MSMPEKARQKQNEYLRDWRKKNPQKVKEYQSRYWERKAQEETQPATK